jgi:hypothetical protein
VVGHQSLELLAAALRFCNLSATLWQWRFENLASSVNWEGRQTEILNRFRAIVVGLMNP